MTPEELKVKAEQHKQNRQRRAITLRELNVSGVLIPKGNQRNGYEQHPEGL